MSPETPDSLPESVAHQRRQRRWLVAAGSAAALAGMAVAWQRLDLTAPDAQPAAIGIPPGFWDRVWPTPSGGSVPMRSFAGKPLLINFWATWCPPCVEELPLINSFFLKNRANGWQVLGLAADQLQPVQAFLRKAPLDFPVGMAGSGGIELARTMGNLTGGLPFTVILGADASILHRKMGGVSQDDLQLWSGLK
jgi:thiol-disulfide isomerase/thioredoxin